VPHFQLVTTDGEALGAVELGRPDWPVGSVIYRGRDEANLRVLNVLPCDDDPQRYFAVLVVEPMED
jgi:hypothetical protein